MIEVNGAHIAGRAPTLDATIVIPAYNEASRLPATVADILVWMRSRGKSFEVIVVDDGSSDKTAEVVNELAKSEQEVRLISLPANRGKGYAVRIGVINAKGRLVLFDDADGSTPIGEFARLEDAIGRGADVAIGSRATQSSETKVEALWYRKAIGRCFNFIVNTLLVPGVQDTQCGFKLFRSEAAKWIFSRQRAERFSFDVEVLFLARKGKFKVSEVAVNWHNVPGSKVNLATDSIAMLVDILRFRMNDLRGLYRVPS